MVFWGRGTGGRGSAPEQAERRQEKGRSVASVFDTVADEKVMRKAHVEVGTRMVWRGTQMIRRVAEGCRAAPLPCCAARSSLIPLPPWWIQSGRLQRSSMRRDLVYAGAGAAVAFLGCVEGGFCSVPIDAKSELGVWRGSLLAQASETATLQMWALDAHLFVDPVHVIGFSDQADPPETDHGPPRGCNQSQKVVSLPSFQPHLTPRYQPGAGLSRTRRRTDHTRTWKLT